MLFNQFFSANQMNSEKLCNFVWNFLCLLHKPTQSDLFSTHHFVNRPSAPAHRQTVSTSWTATGSTASSIVSLPENHRFVRIKNEIFLSKAVFQTPCCMMRIFILFAANPKLQKKKKKKRTTTTTKSIHPNRPFACRFFSRVDFSSIFRRFVRIELTLPKN